METARNGTTTVLAVVATLIACTFLVPVGAQQRSDRGELATPDNSTITVTGRSELVAVPDRATLTVYLKSESENLVEARAEHERKMKRTLLLAREFGVEPDEVGMDSHAGYSWWRWDYYYRNHRYRIGRHVTLEIRELERLEELYVRLLDVGVENPRLTFDSSRRHEMRLEAYDDAVRAARRKAETMTNALGQRIGRAIQITENANNRTWWGAASETNSSRSVGGATTEMEQLAAGGVRVQAYVEVVFTLD